MGVAIDQPGRDPAPLAVDDRGRDRAGPRAVRPRARRRRCGRPAKRPRPSRRSRDPAVPARASPGARSARSSRLRPPPADPLRCASSAPGLLQYISDRNARKPRAGGSERRLTVVHAETALTPEGWRSDVRLAIDAGAIAAVETGVPAHERRRAARRSSFPRWRTCTATPSSGRWRASPRSAAIGPDTFWTWRETMYRFALTMTPDDVEAVAAQALCRDAGSRLRRRRRIPLSPSRAATARPTPTRAEMAGRDRRRRTRSGHRPDAPAGLLCARAVSAGRRRSRNSAGSSPTSTASLACSRPAKRLRRRKAGRGARRRAAQPARGDAGRARRRRRARGQAARSTSTPPSRSRKSRIASPRSARGRSAGSSTTPSVGPRWCLVHATHMDASETRDLAASGAVAGLCPVTEANLGDGMFDGRAVSRRGRALRRRHRLRTCRSARRTNCGSSNIPSGSAQGRATCWRAPAARPGGRSIDAALAGGAQALARPRAGSPSARAPISLTLDAGHPTLAGKTGDAILDAWIFSAGNALVDCVWSGGRKLVQGGRHVSREQDRGPVRRDDAPALGALMRRRGCAAMSGKGAGIDPLLQFRVGPMNGR